MVRSNCCFWASRNLSSDSRMLSANGHLGVDAVHDALLRECGTDRSVRSTESQASRCHVSLRVQQVCPECGVVGVRLNRQSGLCPMCTEMMHLNEEIAFNETLQREREEKAGADERTSDVKGARGESFGPLHPFIPC